MDAQGAELVERAIRVLAVDDEVADLRTIEKYLIESTPERYEVVTAQRLADASELIESIEVDVAILDLNLPAHRGVITVTEFRAISDEIPIVVLTGRDDDLGLQCIRAGAEDFLPKAELNSISLRRAVRCALLRTRERQLEQLEVAMSRYRAMSTDGTTTAVTARLAGTRPIRDLVDDYGELVAHYRVVVDRYLEHLIKKTERPSRAMQDLILTLGDLRAGPRDLLDLHVAALDSAANGVRPTEAHAVAVESRLVALAMMGLLVDHYRIGNG